MLVLTFNAAYVSTQCISAFLHTFECPLGLSRGRQYIHTTDEPTQQMHLTYMEMVRNFFNSTLHPVLVLVRLALVPGVALLLFV